MSAKGKINFSVTFVDKLVALQKLVENKMYGLAGLVLHFEVTHQMNDVLKQAIGKSYFVTSLYHILDLRNRVFRRKTID